MKVIAEKLLQYLQENNLTKDQFSKDCGIPAEEVEKMLAGDAVGVNTARKFISYFTPGIAQELIDWKAIGKKNPIDPEGE